MMLQNLKIAALLFLLCLVVVYSSFIFFYEGYYVTSTRGHSNLLSKPTSVTTIRYTTVHSLDYLNMSASCSGCSLGAVNATSPLSGYYAAGSRIRISARRCDYGCPSGVKFMGWKGKGPGNYSGDSNSTTISLDGNVKEIAQYSGIPENSSSIPSYTTSQRTTTSISNFT